MNNIWTPSNTRKWKEWKGTFYTAFMLLHIHFSPFQRDIWFFPSLMVLLTRHPLKKKEEFNYQNFNLVTVLHDRWESCINCFTEYQYHQYWICFPVHKSVTDPRSLLNHNEILIWDININTPVDCSLLEVSLCTWGTCFIWISDAELPLSEAQDIWFIIILAFSDILVT